MNKSFFLILFLIELSSVFSADKAITIFIAGDSTAANKDTSGGKVERGWGMMFQKCFDENYIKIDNHALNGRSSLSFINEGHWAKVLELIKPGDFVIIQFGHNDEKDDITRHTDPGTTFDGNLTRYCNETRALGGIPVLMNAVVRRNFSQVGGKVEDDEVLRNTTYADGTKVEPGSVCKAAFSFSSLCPNWIRT